MSVEQAVELTDKESDARRHLMSHILFFEYDKDKMSQAIKAVADLDYKIPNHNSTFLHDAADEQKYVSVKCEAVNHSV